MNRRGLGRTEWIAVAVALASLLCLAVPIGLTPPIELLFFLVLGWVFFLIHVGPQVQIDWSAAATGAMALVILAMGLHTFLRWLWAGLQPVNGVWRLKWTLAAVAITVMMFVAGIAMVGITHQVVWLATAKAPLLGPQMNAARRFQSQNNLKQIAIAAHDREEQKGHLPPGMLAAADGQALHGWQTLLLPYLDLSILSQAIDLKRPWTDDVHRAPLSQRVPAYSMPYQDLPEHDERGYALSHYAANERLLGGTHRRSIGQIPDGTTNTILGGEAAGDFKPWGHPRNWRDPALGINASPGGFGSPAKIRGAVFVFADGRTEFLSDDIDPEVLRALATPAAGDKVGEY